MNDVCPTTTTTALMAQHGGNRSTAISSGARTGNNGTTAMLAGNDIPASWTQTSSNTTTIAASPSAQNARERITLGQPRPDGQRITNYYTETPFRPPKLSGKTKEDNNAANANHATASVHTAGVRQTSAPGGNPVSRVGRPITTPLPLPTTRFSSVNNTQTSTRTITTQPCTFSKEKPDVSSPGDASDSTDDNHGESIICHECGRCKCEACRNPRPLPSTWICNDKCECSAEACVDLCTCMCCVKAAFYHCTDYDTDGDSSCADKPCSCNPHRRCLRWGCMGVLAVVLPCLLCYFPMKGCVKMCESCYARYTSSHGCRCTHRRKVPNSNKRLLDPGSDC